MNKTNRTYTDPITGITSSILIADPGESRQEKSRVAAARTRSLSDEDAIEAFKMYHNTNATQTEVAEKFGVTPGVINGLVNGQKYFDVTTGLPRRKKFASRPGPKKKDRTNE